MLRQLRKRFLNKRTARVSRLPSCWIDQPSGLEQRNMQSLRGRNQSQSLSITQRSTIYPEDHHRHSHLHRLSTYSVKTLNTEDEKTAPFENPDASPCDVSHTKYITIMATNVIITITITSETADPMKDNSININSWNIFDTWLGIPCQKLHTPSTFHPLRNHMTWSLSSTSLGIAYRFWKPFCKYATNSTMQSWN